MTTRHRATLFAAIALVGLIAFPALAGAQLIGIYRNPLDSLTQRSQLVKISGESCERRGVKGMLRITIGKKTEACALRTPVVGRDLEIVATERLLSGTPKSLQHKSYLGLELRAGGEAKYEMRVFPLQSKVQLIKITPEQTKYLAIAKDVGLVRGVNKANALRLRATNITEEGSELGEKGNVVLLAFLGSEQVAEAIDKAGGELQGRASAITVGALKTADGLVASVDNVIVRLPSPF
jgi:hypothetical protein